MRFSVVVALCATPLAFAGSLHGRLLDRGVVELGNLISLADAGNGGDGNGQGGNGDGNGQGGNGDGNGNGNGNGNGRGDGKGNGNNNNGQVSSVNEIIIIWANQGGGAATSTVTDTVTVTDVAGAAVAAATHSVTVGGTAGLVYSPDSVQAAVGDMVVFTFMSANHTVTQSGFTTPCNKMDGGIDSGFIPNANNSVVPAPQMAMQVTVATPIWVYCKQANHCGKGMVFSINPTTDKTQAMFQQQAIAQNGTGAASPITGGAATAAAPAATDSAAAPEATDPAATDPAATDPAATDLVATDPAATAAAATNATAGSTVAGTGTVGADGACNCACLCGAAAFPNAAAQGVGAFGGLPGAMPLSAIQA